jgi:uncharacterized membrane protein YfcA
MGPVVPVVGILFVATLIRSTFGFGEALVAVPLLALFIPVQVAAPVAALTSITVAALVLIFDWRHVHVQGASRLLLATLFGIPLGLILLRSAPESVVKAVLAVFILAFSLHALAYHRRRASPSFSDDRRAWIFGFVAGILGGAYGMNGPPLVIYGGLRGWSPQEFRATLQGYFLPASLMVMAGYWSAGLWTPTVTRDYGLSLAPIGIAVYIGGKFNRRINARRFIKSVYIGLVLVGLVLLVQAANIFATILPR